MLVFEKQKSTCPRDVNSSESCRIYCLQENNQPPQRTTGTFRNYLAKDTMPMNTVSTEEFVTKKLDIRYEIPPRNYSPRSSFQKCTSLTGTWRKHKSLNNSTFFWSTWMTEPHTSITHFLPEDYKPKTQWPETLYFPESHTNTQSVCWCVYHRQRCQCFESNQVQLDQAALFWTHWWRNKLMFYHCTVYHCSIMA